MEVLYMRVIFRDHDTLLEKLRVFLLFPLDDKKILEFY